VSSSRPQPSPRQQYRQIAPGQRIAPQSAPPKRTPLAVKVIVGSIVGLLALGTLGFCSAVLVAIMGEAPAAAPNPAHDVELQSPAQQLRIGKVNARTQGLDGGQLHKASRLGAWLTTWQQTGIEHSDDPAADVRRLARSYKATGVASRKVTTLLDEAASQLDQARDATDRGSYSAAIRHHKEAAAQLKGVAPRVRADAKRTEHATGARISGRKTTSSTNYNYLFPLTVKTSTATCGARPSSPENRRRVLIGMELSDSELQQIAEADRREVDPPIQVETATWSNAGQLDWWVKDRQQWWGRVHGANGRQRWIKAADLRPANGE
jgi:hypothetical protein